MSTFHDRALRCSHCGVEQHRTVATSLNAARSPQHRQAILDGTFQVFTCDACGLRFVHTGEFPYLDLERRQFVGVFPAADEPEWPGCAARTLQAFERTLGSEGPAVARSLVDDVTVRCVFGLGALSEKLRIGAAGYDDVLVEAAKLDLLSVEHDIAFTIAQRPRLARIDDEDVVFALPPSPGSGDPRPLGLTVERVRFEAWLDDAAARRVELAAVLAPGPYVDIGRVLRAGA